MQLPKPKPKRVPMRPLLTLLALTEFKTHNDKSFKKLAGDNWGEFVDYHVLGKGNRKKPAPEFKGEGLRAAKFEHYVQMQQYMRKMGLPVGVYFAVNKNDDHLYAEVVPLDTENADRFTHRAIQIVPMHEPPKRINESPGWFGCKFCDHLAVCHYGAPPERNCRTCEFVAPMQDGTWHCQHPDQESGDPVLSKQRQLQGCSLWAKNSKAFK